MQYGAHLPLIEFDGARRTLDDLRQYAKRASDLGYEYLCANDHLLFGRPWIDGPTALAATIDASSEMTLATTVCLPVIRGPVLSAKMLSAIDILSDGRLVAGVGPGSSPRDYAAIGVPFEERWRRFDEAICALRSLLDEQAESFTGEFYSTDGLSLEPRPRSATGPPIWIACWGSPAGLRRVARLGDGWLASGYNTTPARFRECLASLNARLVAAGVNSGAFPNGIATMWLYVSEDTLGHRADAPGRPGSDAGPPGRRAARARAPDWICRAVRRTDQRLPGRRCRTHLRLATCGRAGSARALSQRCRAARSRGLGDPLEGPCLAIMRACHRFVRGSARSFRTAPLRTSIRAVNAVCRSTMRRTFGMPSRGSARWRSRTRPRATAPATAC